MLDLASDLLFFWGGGASWLDRDLDWGYQAVHWATMYVGDQRGVTGARLDLRSGTSFLRA